jgi:hypothetical protein
VALSSFLIISVTYLFSCHCNPPFPLQIAAVKFSLTFDNSSITIRFRYWRRTSEGGSLVAVYSGGAPQLIHHNPFRIRRSRRPLPQLVYNPHLQDPFESADSKGLTGFKFLLHLLYFPHLHGRLGCAGNKGFITLLKSALTENSPATPLESALPKTRGGVGTRVPSIRRIKPVSALPSTGWQICQFRPEPLAFRPETCVSLTVTMPADTSIGCWRTV